MISSAFHHYRFGQSRLASQVPLPILPTAGGDRAADAAIILDAAPARAALEPIGDWLHHWPDSNGTVTLSLAAHGDGYRLRFPDLCDFLIDADARRIRVESTQGLAPNTLEHLIVDQLLPRVLSHRGALVAHASAVRIQGRAIGFLGHSGWGKSTLAGLLHHAGHRLLSDDCALLVPIGAATCVVPAYPSLRLFEDSIGQTLGEDVSTRPVAAYSPKQRLTLGPPEPEDSHCLLQAIYMLNDPATSATGHLIAPLPPAQACMALVEHSFRLDMASSMHATALLAQAASVLRRVPAFALHYPRDYAANPALLETLIAHAASLARTATETT